MADRAAADPAEARAMIDAFVFAGAQSFEITITEEAGAKVGYQSNRTADELRRTIAARLTAAERLKQNFIIRPRPDGRFIQLDDLDTAKAAKLAPFAFLAFETSPGNSQVWLAVTTPQDKEFLNRLKRGTGADISASRATRIAGSLNFKTKYAPNYPRVTITHRAAGRVVTPATLQEAGLLAPPDTAPRRVSIASTTRRAARWPDYARNLAAAPHDGNGKPDRSNADFVWCMTAIDWGHSEQATAARLLEVSQKAQERVRLNDPGYPRVTAAHAAEYVHRNRATTLKKTPASRPQTGQPRL